jgi:hypothetical protein
VRNAVDGIPERGTCLARVDGVDRHHPVNVRDVLSARAEALLLALALSLVVTACQRGADSPGDSSSVARPSTTPAAVVTAPEKPSDALASHNTNFQGVIADVTEFRRKGNVLTALVRLRNQLPTTAVIQIDFTQTSVIDEAGAKKYEVLKDEKGAYIGSGPTGIYEGLAGAGTMTIWMKFPAPPPEVRIATLAIASMPPFDDLPIQDR